MVFLVRRWNLALLTVLLLCWAGVLLYLGERGLKTYLPGALAVGLIPALLVFPERRRGEVVTGTLAVYAPIFALFYLMSKEGLAFEARSQIGLAVISVALVVLGFSTLIRLSSVRRALPWMIGAGITGALIAYFSSGKGGAHPMLLWVMNNLHLGHAEAYRVVFLVRKTIHFCCYGTVAALTFKAALAATNSSPHAVGGGLEGASPSPREGEVAPRSGDGGGNTERPSSLWPAILFALLWTLPHAAFDEWRQAFEPNRGPSGRDVALDMLGALTFVLILVALHRRSRKPLQ